jgi:type VI secretion system protein VasI
MPDATAWRSLALLLPLVVSALAPAAGWAQDGSICALLADDRKRLDCYDLLFKKPQAEKTMPAQPAKTKPATGTGRWEVEEETSKLDDSLNVVVAVASEQTLQGRAEGKRATLSIGCFEGRTVLWVHFGGLLMADHGEYGIVTYRLDKQTARSTRMYDSTDGYSLGLGDPDVAIAFVKSMLGADGLVFRATPFQELAVTLDFPITGLAEAIKPLRKACHW